MAKAPISAKKDRRPVNGRKRARIIELRESGKTFQQIADIMAVEFEQTYSRQSIHELYKSALKGIVSPSVETYRESVIGRTERIYSELTKITSNEQVATKDRISAYKTLLSAQDQLIKVLGIAAPKKVENNVTISEKGEAVKAKLLEIANMKEDDE